MTALAAISSQETEIWDRDGEPSRLLTGPEGAVDMSDNKPVKQAGLVKVKVQAEITLTLRYWCIRRSTVLYPYIFRILVPFIRNGDLERFPLAKTKRPVDLKLSVKVGLGK